MTNTDAGKLVGALKSRAAAWKRAATTKEIRDTVTIYEKAATTITALEQEVAELQTDVQQHVDIGMSWMKRAEAAEATNKELREALEKALAHVEELEAAWSRGLIEERDTRKMGGTRSNRNTEVRAALQALTTDTEKSR